MKLQKVAYFPVLQDEQALLERVRHPDLARRRQDVLEMLDLLAESSVTPADLEQALQLLEESRQSEGMDARFENLEARLGARLEKSLVEIEGRLSRRLAGETVAIPDPPPALVDPPKKPNPEKSTVTEVPEEANLAFRVAGDVVWGPSAAQFYKAIWAWLFENGHVSSDDLPIQGRGKKRYVVAAEPTHPTGKPFYRAEEVHGAFVEVNLSRPNIVRRSKRYLEKYGVPFEVLVGPEA